ncbi:MAG: beta-galactosidase [Victivallales bacterium]|nr:beta-galactosidase [Victivallales bacterium]
MMLCFAVCTLLVCASEQVWHFGESSLWRATGAVTEQNNANSTEYLSSETAELSIWSPDLDLDADEFQSLEVFYHLEGVATLLSLTFETAEHPGDLNGRVITIDLPINILRNPRKVVFDLAANPNWKGHIRKLRLMLDRRWGGEQFRLHAVTLRGVKDTLADGTNVLKQYWTINDKTGQFCTKVLHIRQDFRYRLRVNFVPEGLVPTAKACFWDAEGQPCAEIPLKHVADGLLEAEYIAQPEWFRGEVQVHFTGSEAEQRGHLLSASLEALGSRLQWQGEWIWPVKSAQVEQTACFLKDFDLECEPQELVQALLQATGDDAFSLYINGIAVTNHNNWAEPRVLDVREFLRKGRNRIFVKALNHTAAGAFLAELRLDYRDGRPKTYIATSPEWLATLEEVIGAETLDYQPNAAQWTRPVTLGRPPTPPWNAIALQECVPQPPQLTPPDHAKIAEETMTARLNHDLDFPRIELNGQVVPPIFFGTKWLGDRTESIADSVAGGFQLYRMFWELSSYWKHDGTVDFATLDKDVEELLSANPAAHAILGFRLTAPGWWMKEHPDELCKYLDGKTDGHYGLLPSTASNRWLAAAAECTRQLVEHVEHSWYASRIIGYMPCALSGPEWVLTHKYNSPPDYSDCMRDYFRNFLREKYQTDERLQTAWQRPDITFDTVEIPRENERYPKDRRVLTPELDQCAIDFNRAINHSMGDAILRMMRVIRAGAPQKLTMVYYGYVLNLPELYTYSPSLGHNDLERLISSGLIDIFASPISYTRRRLGDYSGTVSLAESFRRHGVLWLQEADCRTNLTEERFGHKYTHNLQDSRAELRREFAFAMIRRLGIWFYDMNGGWYHNPMYYKEFQQMHELYSQAMQDPTTYHSPVAVVFDPENCDYLPLEIANYTANHTRLQLFTFQDGLTRAGLPFDQIGMDDFLHGDLSQYRLLIFPNLFHLPDGFEERLDQSHCNALFLGAPGLADGLEVSRRLTGLPLTLRETDSPISYYLKEASEKRGGLPGLHSPESFTADIEESAVLAQYLDGSPAAAIAPQPNGTFRVWAAFSENSGLLYRIIYQRIGLEPMIDSGDRVEFDGKFFLVMAMDLPGSRHFTLPVTEKCAVFDAFSGERLTDDARDFCRNLNADEIRLMILE